MASIVLAGSSSGSVTVAAPAAAGSTTLTLPAVTGTVVTSATAAANVPKPTALSTASGSAPSFSARAWVNFNGTGTVAIRASANVSSITDNGTGDYTVNFATAMADANYAISATGEWTSGTEGEVTVYNQTTPMSTTQVRIINGVPGNAGSTAITPRNATHLFISILR